MYRLFVFFAMFLVACNGPMADMGEDTYSVTVPRTVHGGVVKVSASTFKVGDLVRLEVTPSEGMKLKDGSLTYSLSGSTSSVPIRRNSFFMPAGDVKIDVEFASINDTQLSFKNILAHSLVLQGAAVLDAEISSAAEDLTITWQSTDESMVTIEPSNTTGTRIRLNQKNTGVCEIIGTSSDGSTIRVEVTLMDNNFHCTPEGIVTGVTSLFKGGNVQIPAYINGVAVKEIGSHALSYCNIENIALPDGLEVISANAFEGNKISALKLPKSLTTVGRDAFEGCSLQSITCSVEAASSTVLEENAFGADVKSIIVSDGEIAPFRTSETWKPYVSKIQSPGSNKIVLAETKGGSVITKCENSQALSALTGEKITIEYELEPGWQLVPNSIKVSGTDGFIYDLKYSEDGAPYFLMPNRTVNVSATFEKGAFNYIITNEKTPSIVLNDVSYGNITVSASEDVSKLTITPAPKFGYYLSDVAVKGVPDDCISTDANGPVKNFIVDISNAGFTASADVEITAYWSAKLFDVRLYSSSWPEQVIRNVGYGHDLPSLASRIQPPAKIGYTFSGFYSDENGLGRRYYMSDMNTSGNKFIPTSCEGENEVVLHAYFEPNLYTITFLQGAPEDNDAIVSNGNANPNASFTAIAKYNDALPYVDVPKVTYENYRFEGYWTIPANANEKAIRVYDSSGVPVGSIGNLSITSNIKLQGRWGGKERIIFFNYNGPTDIENNQNSAMSVARLTTIAATGITPPSIASRLPYRKGYIFKGFFDQPAGKEAKQYYDEQCRPIPMVKTPAGDGNIQLYAHWEPRDLTLVFRYTPMDGIEDGTTIDEFRNLIETDETVVVDGQSVVKIKGTEYETRVENELPYDLLDLIPEKPERHCFKFKGFFDKNGVRYYDEDMQLDEINIIDGLMPPEDPEEEENEDEEEENNFYLMAKWELDGVEIKSSNASAYRSASFAADQTYYFKENVSITGNNNSYGVYVSGTTSKPTNLYIPKDVTVTIKAGSDVAYNPSYSYTYDANYFYINMPGYTSNQSGGPAPGLEMRCYMTHGGKVSANWNTLGEPYKGGAPGIYVPSGKCIRVFGQGILRAAGAAGHDSRKSVPSPRMDADHPNIKEPAHETRRSYGAAGGTGAAGGGAGIGGFGGRGTHFTLVPDFNQTRSAPNGSNGESCGYVYFYGNMTIYAVGGSGGNRSYGLTSVGAGKQMDSHDDHSGAGGGGGGGSGGAGAGVGGGGGGGGGGGHGGNGIVHDEASDGDSGSKSSGYAGSDGQDGNRRYTCNLTGSGKSGYYGGSGGRGGGNFGSPYTPAACYGGSAGSGGSGGSYGAIKTYNNAKILQW